MPIQSITIKLVEADHRRLQSALRSLEFKVLALKKSLPRTAAREFSQELVKNILSEKFSSTWGAGQNYNERYAEWKAKRFPGRGFWRLTGDLTNSILTTGAKLVSDSVALSQFFAGIPGGVYASQDTSYGGTSGVKEILYYAKILEKGGYYGTQYHPPRPVVGPSHEEYKPEFQRKVVSAAAVLRSTWR